MTCSTKLFSKLWRNLLFFTQFCEDLWGITVQVAQKFAFELEHFIYRNVDDGTYLLGICSCLCIRRSLSLDGRELPVITATCRSTLAGLYWSCLSSSKDEHRYRVLAWLQRQDPSRTARRLRVRDMQRVSKRSIPATSFIALICALPPTRETRYPRLPLVVGLS